MESNEDRSNTKRKLNSEEVSNPPPAKKPNLLVKTISSAPVRYSSQKEESKNEPASQTYYVPHLFVEKDRMDAKQGTSYQEVLKQLEGGKQITPQYVFPHNAPKKLDNQGIYNPRFFRKGGGEQWEDTSLSDWDPNDFRIFVGDLGNDVTDELLARTFIKYPSFQRAKVIRDKRTGKTRGFGFVSFREQQDFLRAIKENNGKYIGNRPCKVTKSAWSDRLDVERMEKDKSWQLTHPKK